MEYEPVTREEFEQIGGRGGPLSSESKEVLALDVGTGLRVKNHKHVVPGKATNCRLGSRLSGVATRNKKKVAIRHDGPDLVVFRIA